VIVRHFLFHHSPAHTVQGDIVPGICWLESLAGRRYLVRDLTRDKREVVGSRLGTPRTDWRYSPDISTRSDRKTNFFL
jgi:hypothetical protein